MYFSKITIHYLIALVALLGFSDATHRLRERQVGNLLSRPDTKTSETTLTTGGTTITILPPTTTSSSSSIPTTSSSSTSTSTSSSTSSSTSTGSSTVVNTPTTPTPSTTTSSSTSSSIPPATTNPPVVESTIIATPVTTIPKTTILVTVTTGGSIYTSASTDYSTSALPTQSGTVSPDQAGSGTSASAPNKSTIIGASVGVGIAVIIAGLGFVAWRIWGKKKQAADEDEILVTGSSAHGEKLTGPTANNPFKSTLDQYHAHSGTNF